MVAGNDQRHGHTAGLSAVAARACARWREVVKAGTDSRRAPEIAFAPSQRSNNTSVEYNALGRSAFNAFYVVRTILGLSAVQVSAPGDGRSALAM